MQNSLSGIFTKDVPDILQIVAEPHYGAFLKIDIFNQDTNTYILQNQNMTELIEPIFPFSTNTSNNQSTSDTEIELDDTSGFAISDRVQIGNYIYKIINILGNQIIISKGLIENNSITTCTKVGNLGIYKVELTFSDVGVYTLIAQDSIFGLKTTRMVRVQEQTLENILDNYHMSDKVDLKKVINLLYAVIGNQ
jgi:hypothetical protein